jgi:hypothetical protein
MSFNLHAIGLPDPMAQMDDEKTGNDTSQVRATCQGQSRRENRWTNGRNLDYKRA